MDRRNFLKIGALGSLVSGISLTSCVTAESTNSGDDLTDIVVVGGTPAGVMAAIAAARLGARVTLTEYHAHIGGMSTSGLGKSDIENKEAIVGLFKEFVGRVLKHYSDKYGEGSEDVARCKNGYYYEPSVAEQVFNQMIAEEKNITVLVLHQIEDAVMDSERIAGVVFTDRAKGEKVTVRARMFIDATYEGDLLARAGAAYRLGREGKEEFDEEHAGKIFFDFNDKVILEGSTGEGDKRLPAYTYRLCMTDDPDNSYVLKEPPPGYDRNNYTKYFADLKEGRLSAPKNFREGHGYYADHFDTMVRVFSFTEIPNRKYDVNINPRPLGFPFVEKNYEYPEAGWEDRQKIFDLHRNLTLGLIWFVQNDSEVPAAHRKMARQYHLPLDEFTDNEHFPWQLYIREGRRLKGQYTLTENDVTLKRDAGRTTIFTDTIITGEFPIDSFPVTSEPSRDKKVLEGYIGLLDIAPYQVPYRILIPEKIRGLIVPVAASTTHVAFSTVRMEPLWMAIGQVAGIAAQMANKMQVDVGELPVHQLQNVLIENDQILTYFEDMDPDDKAFKAVQFWGTKGFFDSYVAGTQKELSGQDLTKWLGIFDGLTGGKSSADAVGVKEQMDVSSFSKLVQKLGEDHKVSGTGETGLPTETWLYESRDGGAPVRRGEAAMALYSLFMKIAEKKDRKV